jgi:hypothetical protein
VPLVILIFTSKDLKGKQKGLVGGIAPGRTSMGEQYHRAAITLSAMTGNIGIHGGNSAGRSLGDQVPYNAYPLSWAPDEHPPNPVDDAAPSRKTILKTLRIGGAWPGSMGQNCRTRYFSPGRRLPGRLQAFLCGQLQSGEPVAQFGKWDKALNKLEFMVTQEQFMTATARYADIVLPTCTYFERNDMIAGGSPPFYGYLKKIIEPLYESKSHGLNLSNSVSLSLPFRSEVNPYKPARTPSTKVDLPSSLFSIINGDVTINQPSQIFGSMAGQMIPAESLLRWTVTARWILDSCHHSLLLSSPT